MTFAEAIRVGAAIRPQAFGEWFTTAGESCVVGAAYEGLTGRTERNPRLIHRAIQEAFPEATRMLVCPVRGSAGCLFDPMWGAHLAEHLNDWHRWTREQIADWLDAQA